MLKTKKQEFVAELENIYKSSSSVIVTHYHGLKVSDLSKLRKKLKEHNADFKIVKNTLSKIAAKNSLQDSLADLFTGPSAIAYSQDPITASKIVVEFANTNDKLKIVGGVLDQQLIDVEKIQNIAKIPSMDELRRKIVGLLQAPAAQLVRVINSHSQKN